MPAPARMRTRTRRRPDGTGAGGGARCTARWPTLPAAHQCAVHTLRSSSATQVVPPRTSLGLAGLRCSSLRPRKSESRCCHSRVDVLCSTEQRPDTAPQRRTRCGCSEYDTSTRPSSDRNGIQFFSTVTSPAAQRSSTGPPSGVNAGQDRRISTCRPARVVPPPCSDPAISHSSPAATTPRTSSTSCKDSSGCAAPRSHSRLLL